MSEEQQAAERRRRGLPQALDPRNYDPRKAINQGTMEQVMRAQAVARAEAQAATTVVIATIVSLVTSAFGFVAALAWNNAIQKILTSVTGLGQDTPLGSTVYALIATLVAVVVVFITSRFARNLAKKSAIESVMQGPL